MWLLHLDETLKFVVFFLVPDALLCCSVVVVAKLIVTWPVLEGLTPLGFTAHKNARGSTHEGQLDRIT